MWTFRFAAQGADGGELRLSRAQLESGRWTLEVPAAVAERLAAAGATPKP